MKTKKIKTKNNVDKTVQLKNKKHQRLLLMFYFFSFFFVGTTARADLVDTLGNALTYMTGPFGKVIAGLAIAGVGYSCFVLGKVSKNVFMTTVIGIGIIFGVSAILSMLGVQ